MVVVEFSSGFLKTMKKQMSKGQAHKLIKQLTKIKPTDGKTISTVAGLVIKERKLNAFRFYFVQMNNKFELMTQEELKQHIIKFIRISKKDDQNEVISKLKNDVKMFGINVK